jgi:quinol monooxygenase YgiN
MNNTQCIRALIILLVALSTIGRSSVPAQVLQVAELNTEQIRALDKEKTESSAQFRQEEGTDRSGDDGCLTEATLSDRLRFADIDRAREILGRSDEWARQLSAFDRGIRQRTLEPTTTRGFLEFVSGEAAAWTEDEQVYWRSLVDQLSEALEGLNLDIPDVFMVKTTGLEELNAVYVRNRSIIFPQGRIAVAGDVRRDFFLLAHELFHLLSLEHPAWRDELYALLGFRRFAGLEYPAELEDRRLSNPMYGSRYEYVLTVQTASGPVDVTPAYQAAVPLEEFMAISEDGMSMGAVFEAIDFVLLPVDTATRAVLRDGSGYPILHRFGDTDWIERMQRNSSYIIHPDEVMAENFALLMEWRRSGTVPESVPGGPGAGFPVNDIGLLEEIQKVLTAGCGEQNQATNRRSSMVMTILEARVSPERWEALRASYAERARLSEEGPVVESFLVQADDDPETWRIVTVWRDRESLEAMRASGETPTGVLIFRDADAEPRLSIFTVFANPRAANDSRP